MLLTKHDISLRLWKCWPYLNFKMIFYQRTLQQSLVGSILYPTSNFLIKDDFYSGYLLCGTPLLWWPGFIVSPKILRNIWKIRFLAIVIKCKYLIREHFRRNFSSRKEKEVVNVEIEKPESSPMISVSKLNLVK